METTQYRILGVDPALRNTGYCVLEVLGDGSVRHLVHGLIQTDKKMGHAEACARIQREFEAILGEWSIDFVGYEYPMLQRTSAARCVHNALGSFFCACGLIGCEPIEVAPSEWKKFFLEAVGLKVDPKLKSRNDKKAQVLEAFKLHFPGCQDISKHSDCWDAAGIAYWLARKGVVSANAA